MDIEYAMMVAIQAITQFFLGQHYQRKIASRFASDKHCFV